jgi:hypothetical protein
VTAFATIEELTERFPRALTAAETAQAPTMLDDASFLLATRVVGLQEAIDNGDETLAMAAMLTVVAMVRRALLAQAASESVNPGVDSVAQTFGPYSSSIKYRSNEGALFLYPNELDYLLALIRGDMAEAVSMRSPGL